MLGETFGGKYNVVKLLGQGGMGAVYEARHVTTGRRVALKVMTEEVAKHAAQLQRFEREARAAGQLESQYIAQVLDAGKDDASGVPYLVMELLTGSDLDQLEHKVGILSQDLAVRVIAQACMGLSKAHAAGIVHRDIKPGNMFLAQRDDGDIVLKLLDFGVAKVNVAEEDANSLTQTGSLIGTPLFMSPEQAAGEKIIDARVDVWAIGVVLYQALAGRTPHHDVTTIGKLILRICSTPAPAVQSLAPWVKSELAEVVHRALEIEPSARFQSIDAMLVALRSIATGGTSLSGSMLVGISDEERAGRPPLLGARVESVPPTPAVAQSGDVAVERTQIAAEGVIRDLARSDPPRGTSRARRARRSPIDPFRAHPRRKRRKRSSPSPQSPPSGSRRRCGRLVSVARATQRTQR